MAGRSPLPASLGIYLVVTPFPGSFAPPATAMELSVIDITEGLIENED